MGLYFSKKVESIKLEEEKNRKKYGLPYDYFVVSSRFIKKKNLIRLIISYRKYVSRVTENAWKMVLVGNGDLYNELVLMIRKLDLTEYVTLVGFKQYKELPIYYGLSNCLVHASTSEQWGLVVNEAMASGLPVITTTHEGYNKYLDKKKVELINPNSEEISYSIKKILNDKEKLISMNKYSCSEVKKKFTWKKNVSKLLEVYQKYHLKFF